MLKHFKKKVGEFEERFDSLTDNHDRAHMVPGMLEVMNKMLKDIEALEEEVKDLRRELR